MEGSVKKVLHTDGREGRCGQYHWITFLTFSCSVLIYGGSKVEYFVLSFHTERERERVKESERKRQKWHRRPKKRKKMKKSLISPLSSRRDPFFSSSVFVMTLTLTLNLTFQPPAFLFNNKNTR
jgi:hypothetical protein